MATETQARPSDVARGDALLHICREHPYPSDPLCAPGCVAFCGYRLGAMGSRIVVRGPFESSEDCVVCDTMAAEAL